MKISILCTNKLHPVYPKLMKWCKDRKYIHDVELMESTNTLSGGDLLFLISCNEVVNKDVRSKYRFCLVIHASDLPKGRGWSPHIWQILEGANNIPVMLLEAADGVDTGKVWAKDELKLEGHELFDEINEKLFAIELRLMDYAVKHLDAIVPYEQNGTTTYYRKRTPKDSRLDPTKTIAEQFELLRVADPERYSAYFDYRGYRYKVVLSKQGKVVEEK